MRVRVRVRGRILRTTKRLAPGGPFCLVAAPAPGQGEDVGEGEVRVRVRVRVSNLWSQRWLVKTANRLAVSVREVPGTV